MSTGGTFVLITNDGKQDRMIVASELLEKRLKAIREQRAGLPDPNPTLVDIEKTHILFMNAHFKPFAAIGYEYNRVQPTSGAANYGGNIQYNIPQFGDFFSDMGVHVQTSAVQAVSATAVGAAAAPTVRYCDYPGERLFSNVQIEVNGNPLDEYSSEMYNAYRQFTVQPNKLDSWKRCMGQELSQTAYLGQATGSAVRTSVEVSDGHQTPKATHTTLEMFIPLMFWFNKDPRLAIPSVSIPQGQRYINVRLATVSQMLVAVNNGNPALSAANGGLTSDALVQAVGGGAPTITRADLYINNIFVNPDVHDIFIARIGFSLIRVHRRHNAAINTSENDIQLTQLKWPIESLFVGFRPTENVDSSRPGSSALKVAQDWHKFSQVVESSVAVGGGNASRAQALTNAVVQALTGLAGGATAEIQDLVPFGGDLAAFANYHTPLLFASGALKNPVTGAYVAAVVTTPASGGTVPANTQLKAAGAAGVEPTPAEVTVISGLVSSFLAAAEPQATAASSATLREAKPLVSTLSIEAHGVPLYKELPAQFFNSYTPFVFGGSQITSPTDPGAYFLPFCLYPGAYQPSGHVNVSRAREFFLKYKSTGLVTLGNGAATQISANYSVDMWVIASCINFLLISDGSAILRYST